MKIPNHYSSFAEVAQAVGIKPVSKVIKDKEEKQKKFLSHHKCKACGQPLTWVGGSVMVCTNEKCAGIKHTRENADGTTSVWYEVSFDLLDSVGSKVAGKLFD